MQEGTVHDPETKADITIEEQVLSEKYELEQVDDRYNIV